MAFLTAYQGSVCAFCGDKETHMELCHIVPGGAARKGWIAGNLAMGCRTCNEIDGDSVIAFASIKRPDLVADSWPDIPTLGEMGRDAKRENEMRRIRKRAKRGM